MEQIPEDKVVLRRFMGLLPTISFILGLVIGTGIFLSPAGVLRGASGSIGISLVIWILGAVVQVMGALCLTELALYFRQSGGDFVYLHEVYGSAAGFVNTIIAVLVNLPCSSAIQSIVIVKFLVTPFVGDCDSIPNNGYKAGATCAIMLAIFINCVSANWTARTQVFLTFVKVWTLLLVIVMGGVKMITDGTDKLLVPFSTTGDFEWTRLPSGFFAAYWAYGGWASIVNVTEEVRQPNKTVIRGMLISLAFTTILYLLANLAYFAVLTPEEMMASDAVAALFAVRVVGVRWSFIIWFCVVLSATGNLNGGIFTKSRVYFVAARTRKFPFILSTIHVKRRTPLAAILSTLPVTVLVIWSGDIWTIIDFTVCLNQVILILIISILPYLRWTRPNRNLPYKAPLWGCFIYILFNTALLLATVITNPKQIGVGVVIVMISLLMYYIYEWTGRSPRAAGIADSANNFLQKLLLSVKQEADTF